MLLQTFDDIILWTLIWDEKLFSAINCENLAFLK